MSITPERMEKVDFLPPHYKGGVTILARKKQDLVAEKVPFREAVKKTFSELKTSFERTFVREKRWYLVLEGLKITVIITLLSFAVFGEVGFPFKAKIRTILENFPKGLLWCGGYIYFGRKVLYDLVYYQ